jgi:hypothetical protein
MGDDLVLRFWFLSGRRPEKQSIITTTRDDRLSIRQEDVDAILNVGIS